MNPVLTGLLFTVIVVPDEIETEKFAHPLPLPSGGGERLGWAFLCLMIISIKGIVAFAPNIGVMITKEAYTIDAEELKQLVMIAQRHIGDPILDECCCGGRGPLSRWPHWEMDFDLYLDFLEKYEQSPESRRLKRKARK